MRGIQLICTVLLTFFLVLDARAGQLRKVIPGGPVADQLFDQISAPTDFGGFDAPNTTMQEALQAIQDRYVLPFDVNENSFKANSVNIWAILVATPEIQRQKQVPIDRVLRQILSRVPGGAVCMLRNNTIEIMSEQAARRELAPGSKRPLYPLVHQRFEGRTLPAVLTELADAAGLVVLMDKAAAAKASQFAITKKFVNVPTSKAIDTLAQLAGLRAVRSFNVLYVTLPDDASGPGK